MYVCVCVCMYVCMNVCVYVYMYVCMSMSMCMYVCVYVWCLHVSTALGEMPDPQARAQFYDVVMSTAADVKELSSQGQPIDPGM